MAARVAQGGGQPIVGTVAGPVGAAYGEATIDELYYLAQEHANREVGPGEQAYDVKVGSMGTPLMGDDTRQSWPSTYKVRAAR